MRYYPTNFSKSDQKLICFGANVRKNSRADFSHYDQPMAAGFVWVFRFNYGKL